MILKQIRSRDTKATLQAIYEPARDLGQKATYWAVCITHGTRAQAAHKTDAVNALSRPRGWCAGCAAQAP